MNCLPFARTWVHPRFFWCGPCSSSLKNGVVMSCVSTSWVPCYDVLYDFRIKTISDSFLPSVVCRRAHVLITLFVFVRIYGVQHILYCAFVLFVFVLCSLCCQFLWVVDFWLPLPYDHSHDCPDCMDEPISSINSEWHGRTYFFNK